MSFPEQMEKSPWFSHSLNELELMCNVMIEDSKWLDSFQTEMLQNNENIDEKSCRISILPDDATEETSVFNYQHCKESQNRMGLTLKASSNVEEHCDLQPSFNSVEILPAPEYVCGTKSCVTSCSIKLIQRAVNETSSKSYKIQRTMPYKKVPRTIVDRC